MSTDFVSHPVFDVESQWTRNYECPFPLADFQKQLDRLTGKTVSGKSRLKVVWGQAKDDLMWCAGKWMRVHPHYREIVSREQQNPETGLFEISHEMIEIGTPRFYVMELHEQTELKGDGSWDSARFTWQDGALIDVLGPIPEEGFYTDLFLIAHHDHLCCDGKEVVRGLPCLGAYRPPGEADLDRVRRILRNKANAAPEELNPSPETIRKRAREISERRDREFSERIGEVLRNGLAPHAHTFITDDESVIKNGKFHFVGGHSKSGLKRTDREKLHKGKVV